MPSPFPGMDPYLEDSLFWHSFHAKLASEIAAYLNEHLPEKYYADVETHTITDEVYMQIKRMTYPDVSIIEKQVKEAVPTYTPFIPGLEIPSAPIVRDLPDYVEVRLRSVHIYHINNRDLVTAIEILSPVNKRSGKTLEAYQRKRRRYLASDINLVELDLLRGGTRPGPEVAYPPIDTDYVLVVNRGWDFSNKRRSEIWPVALNEPLPTLPVPLLPADTDIALDLNRVVQSVYKSSRYNIRIEYDQPAPLPTLRPEMAAWLREHLPEVGQPAGT